MIFEFQLSLVFHRSKMRSRSSCILQLEKEKRQELVPSSFGAVLAVLQICEKCVQKLDDGRSIRSRGTGFSEVDGACGDINVNLHDSSRYRVRYQASSFLTATVSVQSQGGSAASSAQLPSLVSRRIVSVPRA
jgi:hypothetical protein